MPANSLLKMATQLVSIPEVERLSPRCIRILGGNPGKFTLQGTNTYLLGTGAQRILVDTGEGRPSWLEALKHTLHQEGATIEKVLITHWHHDHVGGIPQLRELSPATAVYKNAPDRDEGQLPIEDGQTFAVEGVSLTAVHTPGHTEDHMVFVLGEEDALFTGDNVLGQGTAVFEDLGIYMASLAKMRQLFKGRAYPAHGPVIEDGPRKLTEYIEHRRQREEQVMQTLRSRKADDDQVHAGEASLWRPMELVKIIYADVPESLHAAAEHGVRQVLGKLEKEGRVVQEQDRWTIRDRPAL